MRGKRNVQDVHSFEGDICSEDLCVFLCDGEGVVGNVPSGYLCLRHLQRQCDGNASAARPNIENFIFPRRLVGRYNRMAELSSFGAGDEDSGGDVERTSAEVGSAEDVLYRLAFLEAKHNFFQFCLVVCG